MKSAPSSDRDPLIAILLFFAVCLAIAWLAYSLVAFLHQKVPDTKPPADNSFLYVQPDRLPCLSYPHAIVPCGIHSNDELNEARKDPVLTAHYADVGTVWPISLGGNAIITAHISFRRGSDIVYTEKPSDFHVGGEILLTDGTNVIRSRCGNRFTFTLTRLMKTAPMPPDLAREIPQVIMPIPEELPPMTLVEVLFPVELPPFPRPELVPLPPVRVGGGLIPWFPPAVLTPLPLIPIHRRPLPVPVVFTPEMSAGWMMIGGVVFLWVAEKVRRSR